MDPGHTPGAWVLTGSGALTILCSQWMLQKCGHPSAERPHLQTASALQTLLSDVSSFGQATGEPRVLCMLELGGPATHGELPAAFSHCPVSLTQQPTLVLRERRQDPPGLTFLQVV